MPSLLFFHHKTNDHYKMATIINTFYLCTVSRWKFGKTTMSTFIFATIVSTNYLSSCRIFKYFLISHAKVMNHVPTWIFIWWGLSQDCILHATSTSHFLFKMHFLQVLLAILVKLRPCLLRRVTDVSQRKQIAHLAY